MNSFFTNCDFIGYSPSLYIERNKSYRSPFTGFISLIVVIISLLSFGYFSSELLIHSLPIVIEQRQTYPQVGPLNYSSNDLLFMFAMEYSNSSLYSDPTIFSVEAYFILTETFQDIDGKIKQNVTNKKIEMDLCSKYYSDSDIIEKNTKLPLNKYYCAEPNMSYMQGYWGANKATKMKINFNKCENSTANNFSCQPSELIDKTVQGGYMSIKYTTYIVDQVDYKFPLKRVFFDDFNMLNSESSLEYAIQYKYMKFDSDNGLMFPNIETSLGLYSFTRIFTRFSKSKTIFVASFEGNSVGLTYSRSYTKLQTVVTQIGGFIKAITMTASLISFLFSKNLLFSNILFKILTLTQSDTRLNYENSSNRHPIKWSVIQPNVHPTSVAKEKLQQKLKINFRAEKDKDKDKDDNLYRVPCSLQRCTNINVNKMSSIDNSSFAVNRKLIIADINQENQFAEVQPVSFLFFNYFRVKLCLLCSKADSRKKLYHTLISNLMKFYQKLFSVEYIVMKFYQIEFMKSHIIKENLANIEMLKAYSRNLYKVISVKWNFDENNDMNCDLFESNK